MTRICKHTNTLVYLGAKVSPDILGLKGPLREKHSCFPIDKSRNHRSYIRDTYQAKNQKLGQKGEKYKEYRHEGSKAVFRSPVFKTPKMLM